MIRRALGVSLVLLTWLCAAQAAPPSKDVQLGLFDEMASEMERLDGEGLFVRANREKSWREIVAEIRGEFVLSPAGEADFARAMFKLDFAFPNLHSHFDPGPELIKALPSRMVPMIRFAADWIEETRTRFRVSRVPSDYRGSEADRPEVGDELIAINELAMGEWSRRNFEFCKHPLQAQCDTLMLNHFVGRLVPWSLDQTLRYRLKRGERVWTVEVPIVDLQRTPLPTSSSAGDPSLECGSALDRYAGFEAAYVGNRLCVFESSRHPSTAIMRITSFAYRNLADAQKIRSVGQEIEAIYPWWKDHARWDHLIIDLIDNRGGNAPIGYYQLLFQKPFQEQYFRLKKFPELFDDRIRNSVFWGSEEQESWFQGLVRSGEFARIPMGGFLPTLPMFCVSGSQDCARDLFSPRPHPFRGRISVLLNEWCVSACDGFAYEIKDEFGERARFFGHPQAADSAYSRLTIHAFLDSANPKGYQIKIRPIRAELDPPPYFSQTVSVTRSVTASGEVVAGQPVALDGFVPETLENRGRWVQDVLEAALAVDLK